MKANSEPAKEGQQQTISREAGDKAKGFRLQKLRAAKLMLEAAESRPRAHYYAAIEVIEDVSLVVADSCSTQTSIEEDKNYASDTNFTIFSGPVKNTLVSFFDIFIGQWKESGNVVLGFYTTASIGKEKKKTFDDGSVLSLPPEPILELLRSGSITDDVASLVKQVLAEEYAQQYKGRASKGHLQTLIHYPIDEFKRFLSTISWFFSSENEVELKETVLRLIRGSKYHSFKVANKEEIVLSLLLEAFDERQGMADFASRFLTSSDLQLVFKQAESEVGSDILDPVWSHIKAIEAEICDKRNLEEKILAVVPGYPIARIKHLARKACASKEEQSHGNKSFLALKYRSFEACEDLICDSGYKQPSTVSELDDVMSHLYACAVKSIEELKKDYTYTVSNHESIKGVVIDLVDSCFVSFEQKTDGK